MPVAGAAVGQTGGVDLAVPHPGLPDGVGLNHQAVKTELPARIGAHRLQGPAVDQGRLDGEIKGRVSDRIQFDLAIGETDLRQPVHPLHDLERDRSHIFADPSSRRIVQGKQVDAIVLQGAQDVVPVAQAPCEVPLRRLHLQEVAFLERGQEGFEGLAPHAVVDFSQLLSELCDRVVIRDRQSEHSALVAHFHENTPTRRRPSAPNSRAVYCN